MEAGVNRIVKLLAHETKTHKQKLMQQHKVLKEVLTMQRSAKVVPFNGNSFRINDLGSVV